MKIRILFAILIFYSTLVHAQLCNLNLGDPIVNETFGFRGNPQIPPVTSYDNVGGCPKKGQYTISDFLFGCGGYWVAMTGDHTPDDLNGNYMLVNAESTPGIVIQDTAWNICENMTYQFSVYVTNVLTSNVSCGNDVVLPNLTLSIESLSGKLLASYNTDDIPITDEKKWVQYGFTYKTSAGINAVVLKITTNPGYGCGSAFAIDDVVFQNCGPLVNIAIDGSTENQEVCADYTNPFIMKGTYSPGFDDPIVQWQSSADTGKTWNDIPGATAPTYAMPRRTLGSVEYRMVVAERGNINSVNCRIRSNSIFTSVHPVPAHKPPQNISGCTGKDYALPAADLLAQEIKWNGPNGFSSYTTYPYPPDTVHNLQFADTGLYVLHQTFFYGCTTTDSFYLKVAPGITISTQPSHAICEGESQQLAVSASAPGTFKWTPAIGLSNDAIPDPVAKPKDSIIYKVTVTNASGCQDSAFLPIDVYKKPRVNAGEDKTIISGDTAILNGVVTGTALNYSWSPAVDMNDYTLIRPDVYPSQDITYTLNATSTFGCGTASDQVYVKVFKAFFIPNAFTPNGDGLNDKFRIYTYDGYTLKHFEIYNRWGTVIYSAKDASNGWDGTYKNYPQPMGSYIYRLELSGPNNKKIIKQGAVALLR